MGFAGLPYIIRVHDYAQMMFLPAVTAHTNSTAIWPAVAWLIPLRASAWTTVSNLCRPDFVLFLRLSVITTGGLRFSNWFMSYVELR
jgi:hypothetical protein